MTVSKQTKSGSNVFVSRWPLYSRPIGSFAVNGIDFEIPAHSCFGFLGPNGAGKTTTLRMILGLTPMSSGSLQVFDLPVPEQARRVRARSGVVPQMDTLDPDFTVEENLQVYASYFGNSLPRGSDRLNHLLDFAALKSPITAGFAREPPHCAAPAELLNSLSRPVCLQTSRLRGFSTELVRD